MALGEYFKSVGRTPLLTKAEEQRLAIQMAGDDRKIARRARDRMIKANLRLAINIAKKYSRKGCSLEDLVQETSLGLIKAVDRFDHTKGFRFSTYAYWWIKQAAQQHLAEQSGAIKLPTYAKGTLYKMKKLAKEYEEEFGRPPSQQEVADLLGTSLSTLQSLVKSASTTVSLDGSAFKNDQDASRKVHETLVDRSAQSIDEQLDQVVLARVVKEALAGLSAREEAVLRLRFGISEDDIINTPQAHCAK